MLMLASVFFLICASFLIAIKRERNALKNKLLLIKKSTYDSHDAQKILDYLILSSERDISIDELLLALK